MKINAAITQAFEILPEKMRKNSAAVRVHLLTFNRQEDPQALGYQKVSRTAATNPANFIDGTDKWAKGPARGNWQFEQGGGVKGVLKHPSTAAYAKAVCEARGVEPEQGAVWLALETDQVLAAAFARLLMWTDPQALPAVGQVKDSFDLYLRLWRPGAYSRGTPAEKDALWKKFQRNYIDSMDEVAGD